MSNARSRSIAISTALSQIEDILQPDDILIAIFRHGEKNGDELTELGKEQIEKAVWQFAAEILVQADRGVDVIMTSGLNRTAQAASLAQRELRLNGLQIEEEPRLNPFPTIKQIKGDVLAEAAEIRKVRDAVATALQTSVYAQQGKALIQEMLLHRSTQMQTRGQRTAIGFSHSPWVELGVLDPDNTHYGVEEAEAAVYIIRGGALILGRTLLGPMEGKRN